MDTPMSGHESLTVATVAAVDAQSSLLPFIPPLALREYATFSRRESRQVFRGQPRLGRAWGIFYCDDALGNHWTLLGRSSFIESMRARATPFEGDDRPAIYGVAPVAEMVDLDPNRAVGVEHPLPEFGAEWAIRGWADEWEALGGIDVYPLRRPDI